MIKIADVKDSILFHVRTGEDVNFTSFYNKYSFKVGKIKKVIVRNALLSLQEDKVITVNFDKPYRLREGFRPRSRV